MKTPAPGTVTRLLGELAQGRRSALDDLLPLVYGELRTLARLQRRRWQGDYTMDTTALVHEAYLKLVDQKRIDAGSRAHFFAVAAKAMRHILCNYARDRRRQKRGGEVHQVPLDEAGGIAGPADLSIELAQELVALDDALRRLEVTDPRLSNVVECRFFAGMSIEETAAALGIAPATTKRAWNLARAWLFRELHGRH
jgi:RNA polymerase sigma factor (TIGR02999 family)